jgi:hypothetical protein
VNFTLFTRVFFVISVGMGSSSHYHMRGVYLPFSNYPAAAASLVRGDGGPLPTSGALEHGFRGAGSSNLSILTFPDFESLTCGSHHMQGPLVSDTKSEKVRVRKLEDPAGEANWIGCHGPGLTVVAWRPLP